MTTIEFDYLISPDGKQYLWHDGAGKFLLSNGQEGLGHADYTLLEQHGPFQHGNTALGYRLLPRTVTYIHYRKGCSRDDYWQIRADIIKHTRINRQAANSFLPFQLRKVLPDGSQYDLDVFPKPFLFSAQSNDAYKAWAVDGAIRFYAPDPTLYNPVATVLEVDVSLCDNLVFPFSFPFAFCGGEIAQTDTITYAGNWLAYPIIRITGPANKAVINNITTSEKLAFSIEIPDGKTITIDLRYGYKTVTDDTGANWIGYLTSDSDLATFHLAPDPEAPGGVNSISATAVGVSGRTHFEMTYNTRYIGI